MRTTSLIIPITAALILLAFIFAPFVFADYTITTTANTGNEGAFGSTGRALYAGPFTTVGAGTIQTFTACLLKNQSPTDEVIIRLEADNGSGKPDNTPIATTGAVTASTIPTSATDVTFSFASPQTLAAATKYWLIMERTGALTVGDTDNVHMCGNVATGGIQAWASTLGTGTWDQDYIDYNQRYVITVAEVAAGTAATASIRTAAIQIRTGSLNIR